MLTECAVTPDDVLRDLCVREAERDANEAKEVAAAVHKAAHKEDKTIKIADDGDAGSYASSYGDAGGDAGGEAGGDAGGDYGNGYGDGYGDKLSLVEAKGMASNSVSIFAATATATATAAVSAALATGGDSYVEVSL